MSPAIATVIASAVGVVGIVIGSIVSALMNRGKDSADIAQKVSDAWDPMFGRMNEQLAAVKEQCDDCREKLKAVNGQLSRRDEVTYRLLDVLEQILPDLAAAHRRLLHSASNEVRLVMREH